MALNPRIGDWRGARVWVIGASSGIGAAVARDLIARGARVALSARTRAGLDEVAGSSGALVAVLDVTDHASVKAAASEVVGAFGEVDLVMVVAGTHREMRAQTWDLAAARELLEVNLHGVLNCLDVALPILRGQGSGGIAIFSSVAGYVGLPKALVYGPGKAALINLAESLYQDLHPMGIGVYLVNPGFVDTPLTRRNEFEMPALMPAASAARATIDGIGRGRFEIHYPLRFTLLMKLLRVLPYPISLRIVRRVAGR